MQITIRQREIEQALRDYVTSTVAVKAGKRIDIDLSAKRGAEGFQAVITIVDSETPAVGSESNTGEAQANMETASEEQPATVAKKGSLFGGATKPVNQPSAEPEVAQAAEVAA